MEADKGIGMTNVTFTPARFAVLQVVVEAFEHGEPVDFTLIDRKLWGATRSLLRTGYIERIVTETINLYPTLKGALAYTQLKQANLTKG